MGFTMNLPHSNSAPGHALRRKMPAHDRWACIDCRWSTKIPLIDSRVLDRPAYACTHCGKKMLFTGNNFRPPRRDDEEGWLVAARILLTGFRFQETQNRQQFPTKLSEVDAWIASKHKARQWQREITLSWQKEPDGTLMVRAGRRLLSHCERMLVLHKGNWEEGQLWLHGWGSSELNAPIANLFDFFEWSGIVSLTPRTRVRLLLE